MGLKQLCYILFPQYGGMRGPMHTTGHHGEWQIQVSGKHSTHKESIRRRLHCYYQNQRFFARYETYTKLHGGDF